MSVSCLSMCVKLYFQKVFQPSLAHFICFHLLQSVVAATLALYISAHDIFFNYTDAYYLCTLGCSYFASLDYFGVKAWI